MAFCLHGTVSSGAGYQCMHFEKLSRSHCPIYLDSQKTGLFWTDDLLWQLLLETQKTHPSSRPSSCENSFPIFCRPVSVGMYFLRATLLPLCYGSSRRVGMEDGCVFLFQRVFQPISQLSYLLLCSSGLLLSYVIANWLVPMLITKNAKSDIEESEIDVLDGLAAKSTLAESTKNRKRK